MSLDKLLSLGQTALELGLVNALTVLALFLSYSMLNVCDLSTDGCFTLGAAVGAIVALSGHPWLSIPAAMLAGSLSGFVTAVLQTRMGVQSLLAGIVVNTGLYSVNMAITGNKAQLNMNKTATVFSLTKDALKNSPLGGQYKLIVLLVAVALVIGGRGAGDRVSELLPAHAAGPGHPGHGQQRGHGALLLHQPGVHHHRGPVHLQCLYGPFRLPHGPAAEVL